MAERYAGEVVVVTGAAGGIGRATAVRCAREGARLVLVDPATGPLDDAAAAVEQAGGTVLVVEGGVERCTTLTAHRFGGIDCLFDNAAIERVVRPPTEYPAGVFDQVMGVDVEGVWLGLRHVSRLVGNGRAFLGEAVGASTCRRTSGPFAPPAAPNR
jgi:NAD(P)-dependent dehydrogenase (short-subunit alcohol dehydrogenase family)